MMSDAELLTAMKQLLQEIIDDASPCTSACSRLVDESLIVRAEELLSAPPHPAHKE